MVRWASVWSCQSVPYRRYDSHSEPIFRNSVSWVSSKLTFPASRSLGAQVEWGCYLGAHLPSFASGHLSPLRTPYLTAIGHWVSPSAYVWICITPGACLQNEFITRILQRPRLYLLYSFLIGSNWITSIGIKECLGVIMPPVYDTLIFKCVWVTYMIILLHCLHCF